MSTDDMLARLDAFDARPDAVSLRERTYDLLDLRPGDPVVDVGCGAGTAVAELTARGVAAIGLDTDPHMIDVAGRRYPECRFEVADALALPLPDNSVAGYRADKVSHMVGDPRALVAEAHRVLAPDGRIVLVGQDWEFVCIDTDHPDVAHALVRHRAGLIPSPRAARAHRALLLDAGFADVVVQVVTSVFTGAEGLSLVTALADAVRTAGAVDGDTVAAWHAEQARRAEDDRLLVVAPLLLTSARST